MVRRMTADSPVPTVHVHQEADEIVEEDLIEEVSIDGMCGVY